MPLRFLLGRAGSGKTHACLEAIRSRLREDAVFGPRLILLVPEQAALQMERALLSAPDLGAAHRAEVVSFRRLALRVLDHAGPTHARAISESARAMVVRRLIETHRASLEYYSGCSRLIGLSQQLGRTFAELLGERVRPTDLAPESEAHAEGPAVKSSHRAKLHDVSLLFQAYLEYLGTQRLDPSDHLELARKALPQCPWLQGAELWVDGFATMGGQEKAFLLDLVRRCGEATLSLLIDTGCAEQTRAGAPERDTGPFALTARTLHDWSRLFQAAGVEIAEPLLLNASPPPRFRASNELAFLEASAFSGRVATLPTPAQGDDSGAVGAVMLPDRRWEVEYAVSAALRWVRDEPTRLRFRDIGIIARDLAPYHDLLASALSARGIPYFIDRRRPIAHHPAIEFLRALVALAASPFELGGVRMLLKTGLVPLEPALTDELENYLIEFGITGAAAWSGHSWPVRAGGGGGESEATAAQGARLARVLIARQAVAEGLGRWHEIMRSDRRATGETWSRRLSQSLARWDVFLTVERWAEDADQAGRATESAEHRQVLLDLPAFLDDLSFAFRDVPLDAEELGGLVETGLADLTLGLAPPTLDQVLIGSIERSRHPDLKAVILLGFNDGQFPARPAEDSILNDDDRDSLAQRGIELSVNRRERVLDEQLLAYIAFTRPSHRLLVTCAAADERGKELRPSPYVGELAPFLPGGSVTVIDDPSRSRACWDVQTTRDLVGRLAREFRARPDVRSDAHALRATWNTLYEHSRASGRFGAAERRVFADLGGPRGDRLSPPVVRRLLGPSLSTSVTALESFAACPFRFFARHALALTQRPEAGLDAMDVGAVHHAILEGFVRDALDAGSDVVSLPSEQVEAGLEASWQRVCARWAPAMDDAPARDAYVLRRAAECVNRSWSAQRAAVSTGRARPRRAEAAFGLDVEGSLPAWTCVTPNGREVRLRGFIDRVDLAEWMDETLGVVIDYKSGERRLDLGRAYHGVSLQLLAYLLVLTQQGTTLAGRPIRPLAALYVNLRPAYERVNPPRGGPSPAEGESRTIKARGLVRASRLEALESVGSGERARYYQVQVKKDGSLADPDRNDAVEDGDLDAILGHVRAKMGELADGILDGDTAVRPCRLNHYSACSFCEYAAVCGYEMTTHPTRFLEDLKRGDVLARLRAERASSAEGKEL